MCCVCLRCELLSQGRGTAAVLTRAYPTTRVFYMLQMLLLCLSMSCRLARGEGTLIFSPAGSPVKLDAGHECIHHT